MQSQLKFSVSNGPIEVIFSAPGVYVSLQKNVTFPKDTMEKFRCDSSWCERKG